MGDCLIAQLFVQRDADRIRVGDAGAEIAYILPPETVLKSEVQCRPDTLSVTGLTDVDGGLDRPAVGSAGLEGRGVGVTDRLTVLLGDKIGIAFQCMTDALPELLGRRSNIFKGDGGVLDIGGIDACQFSGVLRGSNTNFQFCSPPFDIFLILFKYYNRKAVESMSFCKKSLVFCHFKTVRP